MEAQDRRTRCVSVKALNGQARATVGADQLDLGRRESAALGKPHTEELVAGDVWVPPVGRLRLEDVRARHAVEWLPEPPILVAYEHRFALHPGQAEPQPLIARRDAQWPLRQLVDQPIELLGLEPTHARNIRQALTSRSWWATTARSAAAC